MPIRLECSGCGAALKVKEEYSGRRIKCPHCETVNRVPAENPASADDDEFASLIQSSSTSSRSNETRRNELPPRRRDLSQPPKRKKKQASQESESGSGGDVPGWAIAAGFGLLGVIAVIAFVVIKPLVSPATGGGEAEQAKVVQAHVDGPGAKFRMKFELPANWTTTEGSIEYERFPWATMKGEGHSIDLSSNKSLLGAADAMTTVGGPIEALKMSHIGRGTKLDSESTDWVEDRLSIHEGKRGPVIWSDYQYKGLFGQRYGIRCTVEGPVWPCNLMLECSESARDKWRPILLAIAESIHYVGMKDGQEEPDLFEIGPGDAMAGVDEAEMDGDPEEMPDVNEAVQDGDPEEMP